MSAPVQTWVSGNPLVAPGMGIAGRGVIAKAPIARGTWFDCAPVLVLAEKDLPAHGELHCYVYFWTFNPARRFGLAFGNGSLYNHSPNPSVGFKLDYEHDCVCYQALRDIAPGEELFINYDYDEEDLGGHPELSWYKAAR
ncbi:MAG TPA: SET domain-containing protein-lysine N-methyltransferase [Opitutales bacterium]|nr:SET domain-containing protein-lysine N-methyltransferase [Opitutales bacterium]